MLLFDITINETIFIYDISMSFLFIADTVYWNFIVASLQFIINEIIVSDILAEL